MICNASADESLMEDQPENLKEIMKRATFLSLVLCLSAAACLRYDRSAVYRSRNAEATSSSQNSAGQNWGDKGYGYMSFAYLKAYCNDVIVYVS